MASSIDITQPPAVDPTTLGVRTNFEAAKTEIETLQTDLESAITNLETSITEQAEIAVANDVIVAETAAENLAALAADIDPRFLVFVEEVTLSSAQIKSLLTVPIVIVPSHGADTIINVLSVVLHTVSGDTAYITTTPTGVISIEDNPSVTASMTRMTTLLKTTPSGYALQAPSLGVSPAFKGKGITIKTTGSNYTGGNYDMRVVTYYTVINV